ncbi:MAG: YhcH/YjgK/YiaL family protein [Lachnospiraceae bacterium]|nr:YhcH/YjgK/YiaL family protein [Lachnospiraceae bacterium]
MIFGNIHAKETERAYEAPIRRAIRYCRETDVSQMGESRFSLDGEDLIAIICDRMTGPKQEKLPEVHRRYAELQFMAEGSELMGYYPDLGDNELLEDRLDEKDTLYYRENDASGEVMLRMEPGTYAIFFPEDVHRPFCEIERPERIKKIVIKIAVDTL